MAKRVSLYFVLIIICFILLMVASSFFQFNFGSKIKTVVNSNKILIVYLSRTKNTKAVAEIIQKYTGGTLVELELQKPYPENYRETVLQVVKENETGFLPPLKTKIDSIEKYDEIFIGFPTWDMKMPPPIKSFLHQYDFSKKTLIPFNTNAGYGVGSGFQTLKELCPKSNVLEGFATTGGIERDGIYFVMKDKKKEETDREIKNWLLRIGIMK